MSNIPTKQKLDEYVKLGLVRSQTHPSLPLTIYGYTEFTSFDHLWNSVTRICRGLVVAPDGRCVVRCMPKFFNEGEIGAMEGIDRTIDPVFYNKLDGSLIQIVNDEQYGLIITSKGSFTSDQAKWAEKIYQAKYLPTDFQVGKTYVFELIHPQNRIVLDYGMIEDLFLLAVIDTAGGQEFDIYNQAYSRFPKVERIADTGKHMAKLVEGVVVKTGSHRFKIKTGEYLRLHRIVTEFTPKRIWEAMRDGDSLEFTNMPEEFERWLQDTITEIEADFEAIEITARGEFNRTQHLSAKEVGLATDIEHKGLVFMLRNDKDIKPAIFAMVKPTREIT